MKHMPELMRREKEKRGWGGCDDLTFQQCVLWQLPTVEDFKYGINK